MKELLEAFNKSLENQGKDILKEELGGIVTLKPLVQLTSADFNPNRQAWEDKYDSYLAEEKAKALNPIVNNDEKVNTKEQDEKIKAEAKKVDGTVENIASHNYDYSPKVDNIFAGHLDFRQTTVQRFN